MLDSVPEVEYFPENWCESGMPTLAEMVSAFAEFRLQRSSTPATRVALIGQVFLVFIFIGFRFFPVINDPHGAYKRKAERTHDQCVPSVLRASRA